MISQTYDSAKFVDVFDERYYCINKRILCFIGQWPYQSVLERNFRSAFLITLSLSLLGPQTLLLVRSWGDVNIFVEGFSPLVVNIVCDIKLLNCAFHQQKIKMLLDEIRDDWDRLRYKPEVKILQEYGQKGRRFTILYLTLVYTAITAWISTPFLPIIMDIFAPLNESRPSIKFLPTDYNVDPDKYFYPITFHGSVVTSVILLIVVAVDTLYMTLAQHVCAMLKILRCRMENIEGGPQFNSKQDFYYQQIVSCLKKHKRSIDYIRVMEDSCQWALLFIVVLNMLVISCSGSRIVANDTPTQDVIRFVFFTIAQIVHLFCNTLPGHWIMDSSSLLPNSAYNCKWYLMSARSRKLIILFIRRTIEPSTITAGRMYVMSMQNFCGVLQTSMSYFTLLTSMQ